MKARRPVSTTRDYRPPTAGPARTTGAPAGATRGGSFPARTERPNEADQHDRTVGILSDSTVLAAGHDLCARRIWNQQDPESRWLLARKAALLREIRRRGIQLQTTTA